MGPPTVSHNVPEPVELSDVVRAEMRIRGGIHLTPVVQSQRFSEMIGCDVFLKTDFLQESGSFKERGARNALLNLPEERRVAGVVAASAGNHALALSYHGRELGIPVTVVMPEFAPITKVSNCESYGANVVLHGDHIGEAAAHAAEVFEQGMGMTYINGFDHPDVIAGAGTMGLEILRQVPDLDYVVVPAGGGGLIAGIALVVKELQPSIKVIAVEPECAASLTAALAAGRPVHHGITPTLADGLAVPMVGRNAFELIRRHVDEVVTVSEEHIALAVLRLMEMQKFVVEGGGATGLAAMLDPALAARFKGKRVAVPLCGGNIDAPVLGRVIERGLATDNRLVRFSAKVPDRPGGGALLHRLIGEKGANVKDLFLERSHLKASVLTVQNTYVVEVRNQAHWSELREALVSAGFDISRTEDF